MKNIIYFIFCTFAVNADPMGKYFTIKVFYLGPMCKMVQIEKL